jgi:2-phosphoglycerate kinase
MNMPRVILIGGAPMVGKSAAGRLLAARLGYASFSTDDLGQAVRAATNRESHPALHLMDGFDYREYYVSRSIDQLIQDADQYHEALWAPAKEVITAHATWGTPAVIDGWSLQPEKVAALDQGAARSVWLVAGKNLFETRLRGNADFFRGASDEEKMVRHFLERSLAVNDRIHEAAKKMGLPLVKVEETDTPGDICERCYTVLPQ